MICDVNKEELKLEMFLWKCI